MHIVFLTRRFFPEVGGVEKHVFKITKILSSQGHKISIITTRPSQKLEGKKSDLKNISINYIESGSNDWFLKFRVWREMLRLRAVWMSADVIHAHDVFFWILPFLSVFRKTKVYTTFHGYETIFPPSQSAIRTRRLAQQKSRGTIAVGEYIQKWYGTKPDYVVYGGGEEGEVESSKLKVKSFDSKIRISFVGRVEKDNGVDIYRSALVALRDAGAAFEFNAYGDGSQRDMFEQLGKVHGFVEDVGAVIKDSDIVFASSYLSILEALSYGKAVFAVYQNELKKDYLRMTPFAKWIEVDSDPRKIARKIQLLITGEAKSNATDAKAWLSKNTWEDVASVYEKLWQTK